MEFLATPSIEGRDATLTIELRPDSWMRSIVDYLKEEKLPSDKLEAQRIRARVARYCIHNDMLYKKGFLAPLLRCIDKLDYRVVLIEIHAGYCDNHAGGVSLAQKVLR